jgi:hypothetical protein
MRLRVLKIIFFFFFLHLGRDPYQYYSVPWKSRLLFPSSDKAESSGISFYQGTEGSVSSCPSWR